MLLLVKDARGGLHRLDKGILHQRKLPMGLSAQRIIAFPYCRRLGFSPWVGKGGHGSPLPHSCLENVMDRGAWRATVHGQATKGRVGGPWVLGLQGYCCVTPSPSPGFPALLCPPVSEEGRQPGCHPHLPVRLPRPRSQKPRGLP